MPDATPYDEGRDWGAAHLDLPETTYNRRAKEEAERRYEDRQKRTDFYAGALNRRMRTP